jgi:prepilin-type N-terminal cleavage/methylation domain-containing protein
VKQRCGFTLLELVIAITLTGVVALLVYGAARTAVDTQWRLEERQLAVRSDVAWQALLVDALRNVRSPLDHDQPTLVIESENDVLGLPRYRLSFITAGGTPPLNGDTDWLVTVDAGGGGLKMLAAPFGMDAPARAIVGKPGVTSLEVRAHSGAVGGGWVEGWRNARALPAALELRFWSDSGPAGPSVLVALPVGGAR